MPTTSLASDYLVYASKIQPFIATGVGLARIVKNSAKETNELDLDIEKNPSKFSSLEGPEPFRQSLARSWAVLSTFTAC